MIDTGAAQNTIEQKVLSPVVPINRQNVLKLTEINDSPLYTSGQVKINIYGYPTIFNLIPNDVPVEEDGVFLSELSEILNNFLRTDNSLISSCKFYNVTDEDRAESN